ncbi:MAG: DUF547 domain-containing protein [Candidatus Latescibacterota bacterium]|nr:MAG: DUF547 domain-containing protein [Candidatus Latescibacterota bacterium]
MKKHIGFCFVAVLMFGLVEFGTAGPIESASETRSGSQTGAGHELFTAILAAHVRDGRVDYPKLCEDPRLSDYIDQLSSTDPEEIVDENERLAFWLNAYNAFTLKIICDNYPLKSINDLHFGGLVLGTALKKTVWDKEFIVINGEKMSLNHIEHDVVRPRFGDPRAHFALVCASVSCPPLRSEAYEGHRLDEQLDDQARVFFSERDKNYFDAENKEAHLSKILDWYSKDFGDNKREVLLYVSNYLPKDLALKIQEDPGAWTVKHTKYDWNLNE